MIEAQKLAIGLFNYAHSYAQSAVALEEIEPEVSHANAPVHFLYFHAIELYLKSCLVACGDDLEDLRKQFGHKVRPLADRAKLYELTLRVGDEAVIDLMDKTDNVISARYIRLGVHTRLPVIAYFDICYSIHDQIIGKVYEGAEGGPRPMLRDRKRQVP
jgi:hypothetical protein